MAVSSSAANQPLPESLRKKIKSLHKGFEYVREEIIDCGNWPVYLATRQDTGEQVAMNEILFKSTPGSDTADSMMLKIENTVDRFAAASRLAHPNIVKHLGLEAKIIRTGVQLIIFMEYCSGGTLLERSSSCKGLSLELIQKIARQLLCGLKYLYQSGVCHLDIKGANILLTADNVAKICDFGEMAMLYSALRTGTNEIGRNIGTIRYMAPEMIDSEHAQPGRASDIYSFGCILLERATGKVPQFTSLSGKSLETRTQILKFVGSGGCPDIPALPQEMDGVIRVIRQCIARDPRERPRVKELAQHSCFTASCKPSATPLQENRVALSLQTGQPDSGLKNIERSQRSVPTTAMAEYSGSLVAGFDFRIDSSWIVVQRHDGIEVIPDSNGNRSMYRSCSVIFVNGRQQLLKDGSNLRIQRYEKCLISTDFFYCKNPMVFELPITSLVTHLVVRVKVCGDAQTLIPSGTTLLQTLTPSGTLPAKGYMMMTIAPFYDSEITIEFWENDGEGYILICEVRIRGKQFASELRHSSLGIFL